MRKALCLCVLIAICSTNLGCLTLGPQVKTELIILKPGLPVQVLQNVTVKARTLVGEHEVQQGIGGWVAMPMSHWQAVKRAIEAAEPEPVE